MKVIRTVILENPLNKTALFTGFHTNNSYLKTN